MQFSKVLVLQRVLDCSRKTAKEILSGMRPMSVDQELRLEKYNKEASEDYKIQVKGLDKS